MTRTHRPTTSAQHRAVEVVRHRSGGAAPDQAAIVAAADDLGLRYVEVAARAWADGRWATQVGHERWARWGILAAPTDRRPPPPIEASRRRRLARTASAGRAA